MLKQKQKTMIDNNNLLSLQAYSNEITDAIYEAKQANDNLIELLSEAEDDQDKAAIRLAKLHVILYSDIAKKHAEYIVDLVKYNKDVLPKDCRYVKADNTCVMDIDCECV